MNFRPARKLDQPGYNQADIGRRNRKMKREKCQAGYSRENQSCQEHGNPVGILFGCAPENGPGPDNKRQGKEQEQQD